MATMTFDGQLEIDSDRGVVYFHSGISGTTLLRIQGLPSPIPNPQKTEMLDMRVLDIRADNLLVSWNATTEKFK